MSPTDPPEPPKNGANGHTHLNGSAGHEPEPEEDDELDEPAPAEEEAEELSPPPVAVAELAAATIRFVASKYKVALDGTSDTLPGLFVPPSVTGVLDGPPLEEVLYLRDETANLAWAVERTVQGPSGDPRNRRDEGYPPAFEPGHDPAAELDYVLQTGVPEWWIPFLPYSTGYATIALAKGMLTRADESPVEPLGLLLRPGEALGIQDEEIPREGARVRRIPTLARHPDGTFARWVTRRVTVGRGEGSSGLAFDSAVARHPAPPPD